MNNFLIRTEMLIGKENIDILKNSKILLIGVGGVGGYILEALVRSGVGNIDIIDNDTIDQTNLNRQILATIDVIGKDKVNVAINRAKSINPEIKIQGFKMFFLPENSSEIDFNKYDFIIDAIDTITAKLEIIKKCDSLNIPLISCMGTGNKLDATKFKISDIYNTKNCKVAKIIRKLCKENDIKKLTVLYSDEINKVENPSRIPASIAYTPAIAGLLISQYVIQKLTEGAKCKEN